MDTHTFFGYRRSDGQIGVRNHVAIISASDNANFVASRIHSLVLGTVAITPGFGRGEIGEDLAQHIRTLSGLGLSPNVYGVVVVSLGPSLPKKSLRLFVLAESPWKL